MYQTLLAIHSIVRWFLFTALICTLGRSAWAWYKNQPYTKRDLLLKQISTGIALLQLTLGLLLYYISPIIDYFLHNYSEAVHQRAIRFFGMEHSLMMLVGIALMLWGNRKAARKANDMEKHKTLVLWYAAVLIILLVNIPWPFSPFAARPLFRPF